MRERHCYGASRRKWITTTVRDREAKPATDLVDRNFTASEPNQLWVADITYIPTWSGFLFLAIVLDVYSRRVVGWAMANHMRKELVVDALNMAIYRRKPKAVVHHSDHGSQYTSIAFGKRCQEAGVTTSMGSVGDCYDNAMCESFNATLECELLVRRRFKTQRGIYRRLRVHRGLVQSASPALSPRLSLTQQLRTSDEQSGVVSNDYSSTEPTQHQRRRQRVQRACAVDSEVTQVVSKSTL
jgi:transposase InsO family protein